MLQARYRCCVLLIGRGLRNRTRVFQNVPQLKYSTEEDKRKVPTMQDLIDARIKAEKSMAELYLRCPPPDLKKLQAELKDIVAQQIRREQVQTFDEKKVFFKEVYPDMLEATDQLREAIEKDQYNAVEDFRIIRVLDDENKKFFLEFICAGYEAELSKDKPDILEIPSLRICAHHNVVYLRSVTFEERVRLRAYIEDPVFAKAVRASKLHVLIQISEFEHYRELYKRQFPTALEKFVAEEKARVKEKKWTLPVDIK